MPGTGRVTTTENTYDFFLELRPPGSSDLNPSGYLHSRGATYEAAVATVRVPDGWAVYVKRQKLIEYRTCRTCGTDEEVIRRSRKTGFGMVVFLDCGDFQNDDEY
jgi:hypothetical protein